jgi:predicted DNA-binding transcriptional regulator YafY
MKIHQLIKSNRFPNCQKLSKDFEVSYKTVQRDFDFMRDQLKLPIAYDTVTLTAERKWHPSQKMKFRKDGYAELSLQVGLAPDLESWIKSWGHRATVLSPTRLVQTIKDSFSQAVKNYG